MSCGFSLANRRVKEDGRAKRFFLTGGGGSQKLPLVSRAFCRSAFLRSIRSISIAVRQRLWF